VKEAHYKRAKNSPKAQMNRYPIGLRKMESRMKN
jgi:hypothetical protein